MRLEIEAYDAGPEYSGIPFLPTLAVRWGYQVELARMCNKAFISKQEFGQSEFRIEFWWPFTRFWAPERDWFIRRWFPRIIWRRGRLGSGAKEAQKQLSEVRL